MVRVVKLPEAGSLSRLLTRLQTEEGLTPSNGSRALKRGKQLSRRSNPVRL